MEADVWRNRIAGSGDEAPDQLLANPFNARIHSQFQQDSLHGVLTSVGWVQRVIVNRTTGHMLDGHLRVMLAMKYDQPSIPVDYVDLSEEEEAMILATFDYITGLATYDRDKVRELLKLAKPQNADEKLLLEAIAKHAKINDSSGTGNGNGEGGAPVGKAEQLQEQWATERGQLWIIPSKSGKGVHRLLCGDSTLKEDADRLFEKATFRMIWSDPPYGVNYADVEASRRSGGSQNDRGSSTIMNDDLTPEDLHALVVAALRIAGDHAMKGAGLYLAVPGGELFLVFGRAVIDAGWLYKRQLVWVKNNIVMGRGDYHYKHEPLIYGWHDSGAHYFTEDRGQSTIFMVDKPLNSDDHPTMKPIDLIIPMITNSSKPGEIVYDPFGGSGSTMVAAEITGRRCAMIELDPKFAAVILQRMTDMGLEPERADGE